MIQKANKKKVQFNKPRQPKTVETVPVVCPMCDGLNPECPACDGTGEVERDIHK